MFLKMIEKIIFAAKNEQFRKLEMLLPVDQELQSNH